MAGKKGPKENSWMMWDKFMTVRSGVVGNRSARSKTLQQHVSTSQLTIVIGVLPAHIAVTERSDMEVGGHLLDAN
jgi:hypothetical protein